MRRPFFPLALALAALAWSGDVPAGPVDAAKDTPAAPVTPLAEMVFPDQKSPTPKLSEWLSAPLVGLSRSGPAAAGCRARLVREWMRIRCVGQVFAVSLLAGTPEGIAFWIGGTEGDVFGEVLMPLRRGDRRVFQLWAPGQDAAGAFVPKPMLVVQEQWVTGERPVVSAW